MLTVTWLYQWSSVQRDVPEHRVVELLTRLDHVLGDLGRVLVVLGSDVDLDALAFGRGEVSSTRRPAQPLARPQGSGSSWHGTLYETRFWLQ